MNDSRLINEHKNAAARVLQHTWHIHKSIQRNDKDDKLRIYQRKFIHSIRQ